MTALWQIFRLIWGAQRQALRGGSLLGGAVLGLAVLVFGAALLGLAGWFITAAAIAGLAGAGATFDVFRPGAGVRFLALVRAGARYGERLLTHDATLGAIEILRLRLIAGLLAAPWARLQRLRSAETLNRLTADIESLDGISLRLVLPLAAGLTAETLAFAVIGALAGWDLAAMILLGHLGGAALAWRLGRRGPGLARRAETAAAAFRTRLVDLIQARRDLALQGLVQDQLAATLAAETRRAQHQRGLDRLERRAAALVMLATSAVSGLVLAWGLHRAGLGAESASLGPALDALGQTDAASGAASGTAALGPRLGPALAALAFFASLALAECLAPLRRALADYGRMAAAARRVLRDLTQAQTQTQAPGAPRPPLARPDSPAAPPRPQSPALALSRGNPPILGLRGLGLARPQAPATAAPLIAGLDLHLWPGEWLALTGASGRGKSTLLLAIAGLHPLRAGDITLEGQSLTTWPEPALRQALTLVPQRSALIAGTLAEALRLADPGAEDAQLWQVLAACQLADLARARQGLATAIGPRGAALSGGEARRLALARAALRRPRLLLLDEPTEGLDGATARATLAGLRALLPETAVILASHRAEEQAAADRVLALHSVAPAFGRMASGRTAPG